MLRRPSIAALLAWAFFADASLNDTFSSTGCLPAVGEPFGTLVNHVVDCPEKQSLRGFSFGGHNCTGGGDMVFRTFCSPAPYSPCTTKHTACGVFGRELDHIVLFAPACAGVMPRWQLAGNLALCGGSPDTGVVAYDCCEGDGFQAVFGMSATGCGKVGGVLLDGLANFTVECPEDSFLQGWQFVHDSCPAWDEYRVEYTCAVPATRSPPTRVPSAAPAASAPAPSTKAPPPALPPTSEPFGPTRISPPTNAPPTSAPAEAPPTASAGGTPVPQTDGLPDESGTGSPATGALPNNRPPPLWGTLDEGTRPPVSAPPAARPTALPEPPPVVPGELMAAPGATARYTAAASAAAAASAGGAAALGAGRLALLMSGGCSDGAPFDPPFNLHPTRWDLGGANGRAAGCVAGNAAVLLAAAAVHFSLSLLLLRTTFLERCVLKAPVDCVLRAQGLLRFPSWSLFAFVVLYQGFASCGAQLLLAGSQSTGEFFLAVLALGLAGGFPVLALRLVSWLVAEQAVRYEKDPATPPRFLWLLGDSEWIPLQPYAINRFGALFVRLTPEGVRFLAVECALALCLGLLEAVPTAGLIQCAHKRLAMALALSLFLSVVLVLQPHRQSYQNYAEVLASSCQGLGLVTFSLAQYSEKPDKSWSYDMSSVTLVLASYLLILRSVLDAASLGYILMTHRRDRLTKAYLALVKPLERVFSRRLYDSSETPRSLRLLRQPSDLDSGVPATPSYGDAYSSDRMSPGLRKPAGFDGSAQGKAASPLTREVSFDGTIRYSELMSDPLDDSFRALDSPRLRLKDPPLSPAKRKPRTPATPSVHGDACSSDRLSPGMRKTAECDGIAQGKAASPLAREVSFADTIRYSEPAFDPLDDSLRALDSPLVKLKDPPLPPAKRKPRTPVTRYHGDACSTERMSPGKRKPPAGFDGHPQKKAASPLTREGVSLGDTIRCSEPFDPFDPLDHSLRALDSARLRLKDPAKRKPRTPVTPSVHGDACSSDRMSPEIRKPAGFDGNAQGKAAGPSTREMSLGDTVRSSEPSDPLDDSFRALDPARLRLKDPPLPPAKRKLRTPVALARAAAPRAAFAAAPTTHPDIEDTHHVRRVALPSLILPQPPARSAGRGGAAAVLSRPECCEVFQKTADVQLAAGEETPRSLRRGWSTSSLLRSSSLGTGTPLLDAPSRYSPRRSVSQKSAANETPDSLAR
ncbi:hypothetical protein DIPPA_16123 [Diplonema papillatum]|nr:hypothetical protein DIPPA_16123 [Diplonema papillatum]